MDEKVKDLLIEIAGFLNLIHKGIEIPNIKNQTEDLLEKIGEQISDNR